MGGGGFYGSQNHPTQPHMAIWRGGEDSNDDNSIISAAERLITGAHIHKVQFEHWVMDSPYFILPGQIAKKCEQTQL